MCSSKFYLKNPCCIEHDKYAYVEQLYFSFLSAVFAVKARSIKFVLETPFYIATGSFYQDI